jgi:hypothetical protein
MSVEGACSEGRSSRGFTLGGAAWSAVTGGHKATSWLWTRLSGMRRITACSSEVAAGPLRLKTKKKTLYNRFARWAANGMD